MCCNATALWNFRPPLGRYALKLFIKCRLNGCEQIVAKSARHDSPIQPGRTLPHADETNPLHGYVI
jgi:hypothetical protein